MLVKKNYKILNSKENINEDIISLIRKELYKEATELVRNNNIINSKFFDGQPCPFFVLLLDLDRSNIKDERYEDKVELLLEIMKNKTFVFNIEIIRSFFRYPIMDTNYNDKILKVIKNNGILENIEIRERTNLILSISEYYLKKDLRKIVKKYISVLFTEEQLQESQQFFIHNFESYFNNFYSSKKSNNMLKKDAKKIIKNVFINKRHVISKDKVIPDKNISYGKDLKYITMIYLSELFHKKELIYKKRGSSLFMKNFYFFVHFSEYIKAHDPIDGAEKFTKILKEIQKKYNFSCVTLDNRFLYHPLIISMCAQTFKYHIESAINNTLSFLKIKDFSSLNLILSTKVNTNYYAVFENLFYYGNSTYIISLEHSGFFDMKSTLLHEMTHFVHFHKSNKGCFYNDIFKRMIDKIYLHKERSEIIEELNEIVKEGIITIFFDENMHCSLNIFEKKLNKILKMNKEFINERGNILNLYKKYKNFTYTESTRYIFWKKESLKYNLGEKYFNQKHEIHARLNEMLNDNNLRCIDENSEGCLLPKNVFELVREDLLMFNEILSKNINA